MDRKQFCILPFTSLTINPTGSATPCCKFNRLDTEIERATLHDSSLYQLFNQSAIQKIRKQFINGEKPTECRLCWTEESAGVKSLRQGINDLYTDQEMESLIQTPTIQIYDLKFTNLCNIKCRMCDSHFSSSWIPETINLKLIPYERIETHKTHSKQKFLKNSHHLKEFNSSLERIKLISFSGGEPLLQPEHDMFMEEIIASSRKYNLRLDYNTNGTVYNDLAVQAWKYVNEVIFRISLDGTDGQFEFLRHGAKWKNVIDNIERYKKNVGNNVVMMAYITVNIYNIFYLESVIEYAIAQDLLVKFNFLQFPNCMSIGVLAGTHLAETVNIYIDGLFNKYKNNPLCADIHELSSFVNNLGENSIRINLISEFFRITQQHDYYRHESSLETFPILSELQRYIT